MAWFGVGMLLVPESAGPALTAAAVRVGRCRIPELLLRGAARSHPARRAIWKAAAGRRREILDVLLEPAATAHLEEALPAILHARADDLAAPLAEARPLLRASDHADRPS